MAEPSTGVPTEGASEPSPTDTEPGAEAARPPFPRRPLAIAGGVAAALAIAVVLLAGRSSPTTHGPALDLPPEPEAPAVLSPPDATVLPGPHSPPVESARLDAVEARLGALDERLKSLSHALASQAAEGEEEASRRESRLASVESGLGRLGTAVEQLAARHAELQTRLDGALETQQALAQSREETKPAQHPAPAARVPFRLVAIDAWDGAPHAVLDVAGRTVFVAVGESHDGWTVRAIELATGRVHWRGPKGQSATQRLGR